MNQRDSIKMTPEQAFADLAAHHSRALATNGYDGDPHVVAMWYTVKDGVATTTSYARAQKILNLGATRARPCWSKAAPITRNSAERWFAAGSSWSKVRLRWPIF